MADRLTIEMDADALLGALTAIGDAAQPYIDRAARVSAESIDREASARLARQLGPQATGKTVAGIEVWPANDGNGYVVLVDRPEMPELPLWLEKGTRGRTAIAPRPYFYISAELEQGPHFRRIEAAVQACIEDKGLGA